MKVISVICDPYVICNPRNACNLCVLGYADKLCIAISVMPVSCDLCKFCYICNFADLCKLYAMSNLISNLRNVCYPCKHSCSFCNLCRPCDFCRELKTFGQMLNSRRFGHQIFHLVQHQQEWKSNSQLTVYL